MSPGLRNADRSFQQIMDVVLFSVKKKHALVYLDDIVIFPNTSAEHVDDGRSLLTLLQDAGVTFKRKTCELFTSSIERLGRVIRSRRLEISFNASDVVRDLMTL